MKLLNFFKRVQNSAAPSNRTNPFSFLQFGQTASVNTPATTFYNLRTYLMTNTWTNLAYLYTTCGIVRTFIDVPVDDAFAKDFEIICPDINSDQITALNRWWRSHDCTQVVKNAYKWTRLYGGAGIIIDTNDKQLDKKLNLDSLRTKNVRFIDATMWELFNGAMAYDDLPGEMDARYNMFQSARFNYYSAKVDNSRVLLMIGKVAPDIVRARLRGWGLSEIESILSGLNRYLKAIDSSYELIDEAKIDVYYLSNLVNAMFSADSYNALQQRLTEINCSKNYHNAITLGADDKFEQKTMSFAGLSDVMMEIRTQLCAELRIPYNRLFGDSATGFASGKDSLEQYATFLQGTIQEPSKKIINKLLQIACMQLFGAVPKDMEIKFPSVISLTVDEEQAIAASKIDQIIKLVSSGIMSPLEARSAINRDNLVSVELEETDGLIREDMPSETKTVEEI